MTWRYDKVVDDDVVVTTTSLFHTCPSMSRQRRQHCNDEIFDTTMTTTRQWRYAVNHCRGCQRRLVDVVIYNSVIMTTSSVRQRWRWHADDVSLLSSRKCWDGHVMTMSYHDDVMLSSCRMTGRSRPWHDVDLVASSAWMMWRWLCRYCDDIDIGTTTAWCRHRPRQPRRDSGVVVTAMWFSCRRCLESRRRRQRKDDIVVVTSS